jgi:hypothetical protein
VAVRRRARCRLDTTRLQRCHKRPLITRVQLDAEGDALLALVNAVEDRDDEVYFTND